MPIKLTQDFVKEVFDYNSETGLIYWKQPVSRRNIKGAVATAKKLSDGYQIINIFQQHHRAHRIIWLYVYGYLPEHEIDHIDKNRANNKLSNLREVSHQCNLKNVGVRTNNCSKVTGVSFIKRTCYWYANIMINYKTYGLGYYRDYYDAVCARLAAEQCLDWHHCDNNSAAYKCIKDYLVTGY